MDIINTIKPILDLGLKKTSNIMNLSIDYITEYRGYLDYFRVAYLNMTFKPDDIFICTYPRSGTTWMQMILYQLTTDGNMDFSHISKVCPWLERAIMKNLMTPSDFDQLPSPRIFKTHMPYHLLPKKDCKYIYVMRSGKDVIVSYYYLYKSQLGYKGTFDDFFKLFMEGNVQYKSWFDHVAGWEKHKNDSNILFIQFEDLLNDFEFSITKIIDFCELQIGNKSMNKILERCSFGYMKKHESQFDHITEIMIENNYIKNNFIRKGKKGESKKYFSDQQSIIFEKQFNRINNL